MQRIKKIVDKILLFCITLLIIGIMMTSCANNEAGKELIATFDGNECKLTGLTELPIGEYSILHINTADYWTEFGVRKILEEGITYQDILDLQPTPGTYFFNDPPPSWKKDFKKDMKFIQVEWDETRGGYLYTYSFDSIGEYYTRVLSITEEGYWFCGPIIIAEDSSN